MSEKNKHFLSGLTVLELGSVLACPAVGFFLAELGARIIKIENPSTMGDVTRSWKLPSEGNGDISAYFSCVNWGKESLALDLRCQEGRQILHALIPKTDIVLVNYKKGDAAKLHMDYQTLRRLNSRLIYGHITGYGPESPRTGYDAVIQAESGFTFINGAPDGPPTKLPVALMDLLAAHQLKEGLLLALLYRERTGRGDCVSVSLMQAGIASLANQAANFLLGGTIPQRMGSDHPNIAPYGTIFKTKDGKEIVLAIGSDRQFAKLCSVLGRPELAGDERFISNINRVRHRIALNACIGESISAKERKTLLSQLEEASIPAGAVNDMEEVMATPQAKAITLQGLIDGETTIQGLRNAVFRFHEHIAVRTHLSEPPHFGQHSENILKEFLDFSPDQIKQLIETDVVQTGSSQP